jgi:S1-C subfamily serine protease
VVTAALPTGRQVITRDRAAQLVKDVTPTLVNITARQPDGSTAAGTGIVVRSDGLVLTNDHVIAGAAVLTARSLATGRSYRAAVLAVDEIRDIAVIALRGAHDLPVGRFGNSARLRIGDPVASIGNAWGLGGRPRINVGPVTRLNARIASTTHPPVCDADTDRASVQPADGTDPCDETLGDSEPGAPLTGLVEARNHLQPGESGGPMIDRTGRIVGLNVAYSGREGHPTGYGYAIPSNEALDLAASMLEQS